MTRIVAERGSAHVGRPPWVSILERHAERRAQDIPTVSVLSGSPAAILRVWMDWLGLRDRATVTVTVDDPRTWQRALMTAWLEYLDTRAALVLSRILRSLALVGLDIGLDTGLDAGGAGLETHTDTVALQRVQRMSHADLDHWLRGLENSGARPGILALCRHACRRTSDPLSHWMISSGRSVRCAWAELLTDTNSVLSGADMPGLAFVIPTPAGANPDTVDTMAMIGAATLELATCLPSLPVALLASADQARAFLHHAPASRTAVSLRSSWVDLPEPDIHLDIEPDNHPDPTFDRSLARIRTLSAGLALTHTYAAACDAFTAARDARAASNVEPEARQLEARARSEAERLLYLALEATPETAGLFTLNHKLDIAFGHAPMEVDLMCTRLCVAVEVDGYHHFRDAERYRRDRRKDLLLQVHRHLVVRCLADDVVTALDRVLDSIIQAVVVQKSRHNLE